MFVKNHREHYGPVTLSYATGSASYCTPRVAGLALREYDEVEIAVLVSGQLVHPSEAGVDGFDDDFESGRCPVAGYVAWPRVDALRGALAAKYGVELQEPSDV